MLDAYGLFFLNSDGMQVIACTVQDCANNGIAVHRTERGRARALIAENFVARIQSQSGDGQNGNGINAYNADEVIITANSIRGAVVSNNVIDHAVQGISISNWDTGGRMSTVTGNVIRDIFKHANASNPNSGYAYGISVEADAVVDGNLVEMGTGSDEPNFGILLGWGPYLRDVMVTGNQVRSAGYGISVSTVEGAGSAKISGNLVTGSRYVGICGNRWEDELGIPLTDNGGASLYSHVWLSDNWVK